jgi:hypothetical protein
MLVQPIYRTQLDDNSGNALGFGGEQSPLLCEYIFFRGYWSQAQANHRSANKQAVLSFEVRWSLASLDDMYTSLLDDLLVRCQTIANGSQMLHPFVYLNYAAAYQDPFALLRRSGELEQLRAVRDKYDGRHFLEKHLKQPFTMWEGT